MLIRFFSSIRKKPKEVRDQYAFWMALTLTGLVAVPWFFGLPSKLISKQSPVESEPIFSSFFSEVGGRFGEVTETIDEVRNLESVVRSSSSPAGTDVDMSFIADDATPPGVPVSTSTPSREVRIATTSASTTQ